MDDGTLINMLGFHPATPGVKHKYELLRQAALEYVMTINDLCPESREKSLAITNLQQASMWAIGSVAINETPLGDEGSGAR